VTLGTLLDPNLVHAELIGLRDVMLFGTGAGSRLDGCPSWGKTGTAENFENAWFDGFTPRLTTVVWMGSPLAEVPMDNVCGTSETGIDVCPGVVYGATIPTPIWKEYMDLALAGQPPLDYPTPDPNDMGTISAVGEPGGSYNGCAANSTDSSCPGWGAAQAPAVATSLAPTTTPAGRRRRGPRHRRRRPRRGRHGRRW
jgi:membrane peptidoglycan carboxypeptidase